MRPYDKVPKDLQENLEYRVELRKAAVKDAALRAQLWEACREDAKFFFNAFCYLYEPRTIIRDGKQQPKVIPFITWPHQDAVIDEIEQVLGINDIGVEKSRGEGASWIGVAFAVRDFVFKDMTAIALISRNLESAWSMNNPDSHSWKCKSLIDRLPKWMIGEYKKDWGLRTSTHTFYNHRNGSSITAYASTGDVATGGRRTWILFDELSKFPRGPDEEAMASTQHVTESRLIVSTPKGADGAYYELMHEPSNMRKVVLTWEENITRNRGMYMFKEGRPVAVSPDNPLPANYDPPDREIEDLFSRLKKKGFKLDGRARSPWYDRECDRPRATPQSIAQELDRDYGGSSYRVFDNVCLDAADASVNQPRHRGELQLVDGEYQFVERWDGPIQLWCSLDHEGLPAPRQYAIGCDVATGNGGSYTSNSVLQVVDCVNKEQILEFASNVIDPVEFADMACHIAKWFNMAYLAWEHNGPGVNMTRRVLANKYPHIYRRLQMWVKTRRRDKLAGFWTNNDTKESMFGDFKFAVRNEEFTVRSKELAKEMGQYVRVNGKIQHSGGWGLSDPSSKGMSHGDRVVAICIAYQAMKDRPVAVEPTKTMVTSVPPLGTMARRMWEGESQEEDDWDDVEAGSMRAGRSG